MACLIILEKQIGRPARLFFTQDRICIAWEPRRGRVGAQTWSESLRVFSGKYPSIKRSPGGASNDLIPNLQNPADPLPLLKDAIDTVEIRGGGG